MNRGVPRRALESLVPLPLSGHLLHSSESSPHGRPHGASRSNCCGNMSGQHSGCGYATRQSTLPPFHITLLPLLKSGLIASTRYVPPALCILHEKLNRHVISIVVPHLRALLLGDALRTAPLQDSGSVDNSILSAETFDTRIRPCLILPLDLNRPSKGGVLLLDGRLIRIFAEETIEKNQIGGSLPFPSHLDGRHLTIHVPLEITLGEVREPETCPPLRHSVVFGHYFNHPEAISAIPLALTEE